MARERPPHSVIREVYERDNYTCQNCGRKDGPNVDLEAHHGVPLKEGGSNKKSNLITYCAECHNAIHYDSHKAPSSKSIASYESHKSSSSRNNRSIETSVRERVLERDNYTCRNCKQSGGSYGDKQLKIHHIVKPRNGGSNNLSNLLTFCSRCHSAIHHESINAPDAVREKKIGGMEWTITETHRQDLDKETATDKDTPDSESTIQSETEENTSTSDNQTQSGILTIAHSLKEFFVAIQKIEIKSEMSPTLENCPICGKSSTELPRFIPPDTVDCEACGARFKSGKFGLSNQMTLVEGDSDQMGKTRTTEEWKNIAQSKVENEPPTNLLSDYYE